MTRTDELTARAIHLAQESQSNRPYPLAYEIKKALLQVEREVWQKVADKIETEMTKENESTDDQIWEIRDWCRQQKEAL